MNSSSHSSQSLSFRSPRRIAPVLKSTKELNKQLTMFRNISLSAQLIKPKAEEKKDLLLRPGRNVTWQ